MKRRHRNQKSGESMVEVMVSAALFLLMAAIMQGAISFCTNAQKESMRLRERNEQIAEDLQTAAYTGGERTDLSFHAVSADQTVHGSELLFTIKVEKGKKEVSYPDASGTDQTAVFYLFGPAR